MNAKRFFLVLTVMIPLVGFGRFIQIVDLKELIANSKLVFVGKVQSVKLSGLTTPLSYPTWEGVSFPWLKVNMEVLFPFKGVRKGDVVQVMMLSMDKKAEDRMVDAIEMLEPDKDDVFFLCLGPTPLTNAFAAYTAPYDENTSVLPLHRSNKTSTDDMRDFGKDMLLDDKRFAPIWTLVNPSGEVVSDNAVKLRNDYAAEIRNKPANDVIYLEWQSYTNAHGWVSDIPKGITPPKSDSEH